MILLSPWLPHLNTRCSWVKVPGTFLSSQISAPTRSKAVATTPSSPESPLSPKTERNRSTGGLGSWQEADGERTRRSAQPSCLTLGVLCCPRPGLCQGHALLLSTVLEFTFSPANSSLRQVLLISPPWRRGPRSQHRSVVVTWFELQPLCLPVIPC